MTQRQAVCLWKQSPMETVNLPALPPCPRALAANRALAAVPRASAPSTSIKSAGPPRAATPNLAKALVTANSNKRPRRRRRRREV